MPPFRGGRAGKRFLHPSVSLCQCKAYPIFFRSFLASLPDAGISPALRSLPDSAGTLDRLPSSGQESVEIVNHYDALLRVDGNVDKDALPGLQEILEKSYRYTTQKQYGDLKKIGYALH